MLLVAKNIISDSNLFFYLYNFSQSTTFEYNSIGEASKVIPIDKMSVVLTLILAFIFLHEQFTAKTLVGIIFLTTGTILMIK